MFVRAALCFTFIFTVLGYENGGPLSVCNDPYPHHHVSSGNVVSSDATSPYSVSVSSNHYLPGDSLTVTITGTEKIKGFQIAAHTTNGRWENLYGDFTLVPVDVQTYQYYSDKKNCVTHGAKFKSTKSIELRWRAPLTSVGNILFSATVVRDYELFWANVTASVIADEGLNSSAVAEPLPINAGDLQKEMSIVNCEHTVGCVTYPSQCKPHECLYAITYKPTAQGIRFRLYSRSSQPNTYLAMGLSKDHLMEHDETFSCMLLGDRLEFAHGYNPAKYNVRVRPDVVSDVVMQSLDGHLTCEFTMPLQTEANLYGSKGPYTLNTDYIPALTEPIYHLYLAWGETYPGSRESMAAHHELPIVSREKIPLNSTSRRDFYHLHDYVKMHATFMTVAWFVCSAIAMLVGRYFRKGFTEKSDKCCGLKTWFQVHRILLISAAIICVIGFVLIFVFLNGFTKKKLIHAGFGIAVMALTCIQILMALLRPDPGSKKRKVYNWAHRLTGWLTYAAAAVSMFLGSTMSYMPMSMQMTGTGLLAGLVGTHVLAAAVLEITDYCVSKREESSMDIKFPPISSDELTISEEKTSSGEPFSLKLVIFCVYVCTVVTLTVCFLTILWIN